MNTEMGLLAVGVAIISWGVGDFLIQRYTRKFEPWETLFAISLFGMIVLTPFVLNELPMILNSDQVHILIMGAAALSIAGLLSFEALRQGKLAAIEPIWSIGTAVAIILAFIVLGEIITLQQLALIIAMICGIFLILVKSLRNMWLERGVAIAVAAAIILGIADFLMGYGARSIGAVLMNWIIYAFAMMISTIYLVYNGKISEVFRNIAREKVAFLSMCIFYNLAWIAFAFAMTIIPIGITVALTEGYILVGVFLGIFLNKEKLILHQIAGVVLAVISGILLAASVV